MNALTREWIKKAEGDYRVCQHELRLQRGASYDAVAFHAQQCVEKYLKGLLQHHGTKFRKTHDLEELIDLVAPSFGQFAAHRTAAKQLSSHAVRIRYPRAWASRADAEAGFRTAVEIRKLARAALGVVRRRTRKKPARRRRKTK